MPQWCLCSSLLVWWRFLWWLVQQAIWEVLTSLSHMVPCVGPVLSILCLVCPVGRVFVHVCLTQFYVPYIKYSHGGEHLADEHLRPLSDQQQQLNNSASSVSLMCACFLNESLRDLNNRRTLPQLDNNDSSSTGPLFFDRNNHSYPLDSSIDISECFFVGKFILSSHRAHKSIDSFFGLDNAT